MVKCGLPAEKMASIGYGEYRPVAPNDSLENMAKNRRVVITIIRAEVKPTEDIVAEAATASAAETETEAEPTPAGGE